jgi:hypothetical protein
MRNGVTVSPTRSTLASGARTEEHIDRTRAARRANRLRRIAVRTGSTLNTRLRSNSRQAHLLGTTLPAQDKAALLETLKPL